MQFLRENSDHPNVVTAYRPGALVLGERTVHEALVLTPSELIEGWPVASAAELSPGALEPVFELQPELILFGSGERLVFPDGAAIASSLQRGIGFEVMDTAAACRTYNVLVHENRRVAAALIL